MALIFKLFTNNVAFSIFSCREFLNISKVNPAQETEGTMFDLLLVGICQAANPGMPFIFLAADWHLLSKTIIVSFCDSAKIFSMRKLSKPGGRGGRAMQQRPATF